MRDESDAQNGFGRGVLRIAQDGLAADQEWLSELETYIDACRPATEVASPEVRAPEAQPFCLPYHPRKIEDGPSIQLVDVVLVHPPANITV